MSDLHEANKFPDGSRLKYRHKIGGYLPPLDTGCSAGNRYKLAERIVDDRQNNGDFGAIEDLLRVSGSDKERLKKIKNFSNSLLTIRIVVKYIWSRAEKQCSG